MRLFRARLAFSHRSRPLTGCDVAGTPSESPIKAETLDWLELIREKGKWQFKSLNKQRNKNQWMRVNGKEKT